MFQHSVIKEISSTKDPLFVAAKKARTKKGREEQRVFLVEDELVTHAIRGRFCHVEALLTTQEEGCDTVPSYHVSAGMMRRLYPSGKQPIKVALCRAIPCFLDDFKEMTFLTVLEHLVDAGNIGTIIRTSAGLGGEGVIVISDDPEHLYSRNAVRGSMGTLFDHPVVCTDRSSFLSFAKKYGFQLLATTPHAKQQLKEIAIAQKSPIALMVGNETKGLSRELIDVATEKVAIQMSAVTESLNVSVFTGIALYELINRKSCKIMH